MYLIVGSVLTVSVLIISIFILKSLPGFLQKLVLIHPVMEFLFNFGTSFIISSFLGSGMISGAGNILGSIIFAVYCEVYYKKYVLPKVK